jgi:hypothetical protein
MEITHITDKKEGTATAATAAAAYCTYYREIAMDRCTYKP